MHPAGVRTEQLAIEHKRKPRQRKPVPSVWGCKGPADVWDRHPRRHMVIVGDINIVIIFNEIVIAYLPINSKCRQCQSDAYQERTIPV